MADRLWNSLLVQTSNALGWEVFHENSKITSLSEFPTLEETRRHMEAVWQSLPMDHAPAIALPGADTLTLPTMDIGSAIRKRQTPENMVAAPLNLDVLAALLFYMAGIDRVRARGHDNRPYRLVPSGGALYPLELFVHVRAVTGVASGLYYYNPIEHGLHGLGDGDRSAEIAGFLVQPGLVEDSAVQLFQTAIFPRSTFKYADRGYRFALIEAGHQAQNLGLIATAFGLGCIHVGGYKDHVADRFLGLDGIAHSTIYMSFVGQPDDVTDL